jgi:PPM family protein phosphatase
MGARRAGRSSPKPRAGGPGSTASSPALIGNGSLSGHAVLEKLAYAFRSEPGPEREGNEDFVAALVPTTPDDAWSHAVLFAVADGMGGHAAGEVASRLAVDTARGSWVEGGTRNPSRDLRQALLAANTAVFDAASADPSLRGMGTTLTLATLAGTEAIIGHVGDSRAYLFSEGRITQLTSDHSRAAELLRLRLISEERAEHHPARSILTRSLGAGPLLQVDLVRVGIARGNVLLLCTDGLWDAVSRDDVERILSRARPGDACDELVDLAYARSAADNVSALVIRISSVLPIPTGPRRPGRRGIFRRM